MFNRRVAADLAAHYDSFYLYDENILLENAERLIRDFPGMDFLYSIKANPHPRIVKAIFSQGFGADAASLGEVLLCRRLGLPPERIYYSAPGKRPEDLEQALDQAVIIADSLGEVERIANLAKSNGRVARIGIRINPDFTFENSTGVASKFGIDEQLVFEHAAQFLRRTHLEIIGIHVHVKSQELRADVLRRYHRNVLELAVRVQEALGTPLQFINLGSGLGIPYRPDDQPLDTAALGKAAAELAESFRERLPEARLFVETGRYVAGPCGIYATRVVDRKISNGTTYILLNNTLNAFLRPSLARLILRYAGAQPPGTEPLFTGEDAFRFIALGGGAEEETVTLAGNLCTAADVVAENIRMPRLHPGDTVIITHAGSYAAVLSPKQFSSQTPPKEFYLTSAGEVVEEE